MDYKLDNRFTDQEALSYRQKVANKLKITLEKADEYMELLNTENGKIYLPLLIRAVDDEIHDDCKKLVATLESMILKNKK